MSRKSAKMTYKSLKQSVENVWENRFSSIVRDRIFQRLVMANLLWSFTHFAYVLVSGWVVFLLTNSPAKVILLTFFQFSALPIVGLFSGALIDRIGNRMIMIVSQVIYTFIYLGTALLIFLDRLEFWHLAVAAVVTGLCWAIDWPARRSILTHVVGETRVTDGYIVDYSVQTLGRVLGSAAAGIVTQALGEAWSFISFVGLSFLAVILISGLADYQSEKTTVTVSSHTKIRFKEVWNYVSRNNTILGVLLVTMCINFFVVPNRSLFPVFASSVLGGDALYLGYLAVSYSLGGFIGIFLAYWGLTYYENTNLFIIGSLLQGVSFASFALSSNLLLSVIVLFLAGIGSAYFGTLQSEILLTNSDKRMRNNVFGWLVVAIGLQPFGRLHLTAITSLLGARLALGLTATIAVVLLAIIALRLSGFWQSMSKMSSD
tara:strand:- start:15 stop:1307 length:1293 start_codon:yes stop_codon:yes gene_type:complete